MKFEDYAISFSDMIGIIKRRKRPILICTVSLSLLTSFYVLSRPNEYPATAHFKELGNSKDGSGGSLSHLVLGVGPGSIGSEAVSAMKSHTLLTRVALKLGLQGNLQESGRKIGMGRNMFNRLLVEWAHFAKHEVANIDCPDCPLAVSEIHYSGDSTIPLSLDFISPTSYIVKNQFGNVGEGRLGQSFRTDHFAFTIDRKHSEDFEGGSFSLSLIPLWKVVDHLEGSVNIEVDEEDMTLLILEYSHRDRVLAAAVLNEIMIAYQDYLQREHDRLADIQIAYLKKRQEEMFSSQAKVMRQHAKMLSNDISSTGFVNFEKEIEFLFKNRLACLEKINTLDLKLQKLDRLLQNDQALEGHMLTHDELSSVNPVLQQLTELKMQRDALTLALTQSQSNESSHLSDQLASLDQVAHNLDEVAMLEESVLDSRELPSNLTLTQNPNLRVKDWVETLDNPTSKKLCLSYLQNLRRLFEMQHRVVQERLTFQCGDHTEYQGIDLETATQLQLAYIKESHKIESTHREAEFILQQLKETDFEINSLSSALRDPISQEIIQKSTALALQLRDQKYHSPKEQERTREELETQKRFLSAHLKQTMDVQKLQSDLLQERIRILQGVMLELIHEKISVFEKHIHDFVTMQAASYSQQKELILNTMNEINQNMATLPGKWMSEQIMKQNVDLNKAIVEELTRLVENKNISHNLDLIQSAPLDLAWVETLPKKPRFFLIAILGGFLGALFSSSFFILKEVVTGIEASPENLKAFNRNVVGGLGEDLTELMRRQSAFMDRLIPFSSKGHVLLAIENSGPDYTPDLAKLLSKKGQKILVLSLDSHERSASGLLQYLEGGGEVPTPTRKEGYDMISMGGTSLYLPELILSSQFSELIAIYREKYDWILCSTLSSPGNSESEALLTLADMAAVTLHGETLWELERYMESDVPVTFMFL